MSLDGPTADRHTTSILNQEGLKHTGHNRKPQQHPNTCVHHPLIDWTDRVNGQSGLRAVSCLCVGVGGLKAPAGLSGDF